MSTSDGTPGGTQQRVLVEMRVSSGQGAAFAMQTAAGMNAPGFQLDTAYDPVPVSSPASHAAQLAAANEETVIVRGTIDESQIPQLEAQPNVLKVWRDAPITPFTQTSGAPAPVVVSPVPAAGVCPIPPCDCDPATAKGTIADVAAYLGTNQIWNAGNRADVIVVGDVDGGITALGRTPKPGETAQIPNVIGGFPTADWGTTAAAWGNHGNMTSTDVLGMAPNVHLYDIRISDGVSPTGVVSDALAGFQWAITQHQTDGTPHVLTNSWGMFQQSWDPPYATDPNHPFTRKVVEAINNGILVLFAAGNCGDTCPDGRCGPDTGSGHDIWGANGHPEVMTVGAVNKNEQFVGYSSIGPAALDPNKPDFCSITHFQGYFASDSGTSAATPVAAGVVALLKQSNKWLTQDGVKKALRNTAKDIGPAGWDQYSGAGIIQAKAAYDSVVRAARATNSGFLVQSTFGAWGNFELVIPSPSGGLAHYWRDNDNPALPWNGPAAFGTGTVAATSLIQSSYGYPGNLEVVVREGSQLAHYWRDSGPALAWSGPFYFASGVAGNPALIQGRFGNVGNFELVVPLATGGLAHYWRDNDDPALPWNGPTIFGASLGAVDAVALIESSFGSPGNLEVIAVAGGQLQFFWRDSGPTFTWNGPFPVIADGVAVTGVSGVPALIQGRFGRVGNFELVVALAAGGLAHYWRDNDNPALPWHGPAAFGAGTIRAVTLIESTYGTPGLGNLELVVETVTGSGGCTQFYWRQDQPPFTWSGSSDIECH